MNKDKIANAIYCNVPAEFCIEVLNMDIDEYEKLSEVELFGLITATVTQVREEIIIKFVSEYLQ